MPKTKNKDLVSKKVEKTLEEISSQARLVTKRKVFEWRVLFIALFFAGVLSAFVWGGNYFNFSFGQQRVVSNVASLTFKDSTGTLYGPYYSNKTETVIGNKAKPDPYVCSDGTPDGQCSSTVPLYCDRGELRDDCSQCGCQGGVCQTDGTCAPKNDSPPGDDKDPGGSGMKDAEEAQACAKDSRGTWVEFPDQCADRCNTNGQTACAGVVTESCDCGDGFCWDGSSCVPEDKSPQDPSVPDPVPLPKPSPIPPDDKAGPGPQSPLLPEIPSDYDGVFEFSLLDLVSGETLFREEAHTRDVRTLVDLVNRGVPSGIYDVAIAVAGYRTETVENVAFPLTSFDQAAWPLFLISAFNGG